MPDQADPAGVVARGAAVVRGELPGERSSDGSSTSSCSTDRSPWPRRPSWRCCRSSSSSSPPSSPTAPRRSANSIGDRFGLDDAARTALRVLFDHPGTAAISWVAILISLLSAFSLVASARAHLCGDLRRAPAAAEQELARAGVDRPAGDALRRRLAAPGPAGGQRHLAGGRRRSWACSRCGSSRTSPGLRLLVPSAPRTDDGRLGRAVQPRAGGHRRLGLRLHAGVAVQPGRAVRAHRRDLRDLHLHPRRRAGLRVAPLLVTTWVRWRAERGARVLSRPVTRCR